MCRFASLKHFNNHILLMCRCPKILMPDCHDNIILFTGEENIWKIHF